jgi:hypothetical protein
MILRIPFNRFLNKSTNASFSSTVQHLADFFYLSHLIYPLSVIFKKFFISYLNLKNCCPIFAPQCYSNINPTDVLPEI